MITEELHNTCIIMSHNLRVFTTMSVLLVFLSQQEIRTLVESFDLPKR